MSWYAHAWAESAPVADVQEFAILAVMAHHGGDRQDPAHEPAQAGAPLSATAPVGRVGVFR